MRRDKGGGRKRGQGEDEEFSEGLAFFFQYKSRRTEYSGQFEAALAKLASNRPIDRP